MSHTNIFLHISYNTSDGEEGTLKAAPGWTLEKLLREVKASIATSGGNGSVSITCEGQQIGRYDLSSVFETNQNEPLMGKMLSEIVPVDQEDSTATLSKDQLIKYLKSDPAFDPRDAIFLEVMVDIRDNLEKILRHVENNGK
jgi:hypothetical protein